MAIRSRHMTSLCYYSQQHRSRHRLTHRQADIKHQTDHAFNTGLKVKIDNSVFLSLGIDFEADEFNTGQKVKNEAGKAHNLPFFPNEKELSEEDLENMVEECYKDGSKFVTYAEDDYETKRLVK